MNGVAIPIRAEGAPGCSDAPVLRERGQRERRYLREVTEGLAERVAWVPWQAEAPVGASRLLALARGQRGLISA